MQPLAKLLREIYEVDEMSPEEFAARNAHTIMMFASHLEHGDPELASWFLQVEQILDNKELLQQAREEYLTSVEIQAIENSNGES